MQEKERAEALALELKKEEVATHHRKVSVRTSVFDAWRQIASIQRREACLGTLRMAVHTLRVVGRLPRWVTLWVRLQPLVAKAAISSPKVGSSKLNVPLNFEVCSGGVAPLPRTPS